MNRVEAQGEQGGGTGWRHRVETQGEQGVEAQGRGTGWTGVEAQGGQGGGTE